MGVRVSVESIKGKPGVPRVSHVTLLVFVVQGVGAQTFSLKRAPSFIGFIVPHILR